MPETLTEAEQYFSDPDVCLRFMASLRWPDGVTCPHCGASGPYFLKTRRIWKCKRKECTKQFSLKVGTILQDSRLPLDKWLLAIWIVANGKGPITSRRIHRSIGVTQKTAWFMLKRIRIAEQTKSFRERGG